MNLITEYPSWYVVFCLLLGVGYSLLLYYRDRHLGELRTWIRAAMAFFRFAVISLLCFLLLKPLLKSTFSKVEKPVIIFAQDDSESLLLGKDSTYYKEQYPEVVNELIKRLAEDYQVETRSFGENVNDGLGFEYNDKQTDISHLFDEVFNSFSNQNIGAVVLASDGIVNKGLNPVYTAGKLNVPIFTVALGDTVVKKDLILTNVSHNRLAYLGNKFPMEVLVSANDCKGAATKLTISKDDSILFEKALKIDQQQYSTTIPITVLADKTGIQKYTVGLSALNDEVSYVNNTKQIYIDVLDSRQKVLILGHAPHPDIAAINHSINVNDNYDVEVATATSFSGNVKEYNLVILHQLPSRKYPAGAILKKIKEDKIPVLYVTGSEINPSVFNDQQAGIAITKKRGNLNESQPVINKNFTLFSLSDKAVNFSGKFPPLYTLFGEYKVSAAAHLLMHQKIGVIKTDQPLWIFYEAGGEKSGVIAGEGLWKWRLNDFAEHGNHAVFNELIHKTVQYLAVKEDKKRFRIASENNYAENEQVILEGEVYNESYELINDPAVNITFINNDGKEFPFAFSRTANGYRLNAGMLPIGEYRFKATTKVGDKVLTEEGQFSISPIRIESVNTIANHQLLYKLSAENGGEMIYPADLNQIITKLKERETIKPIMYSTKKLSDLINLKWIFFLLLALLSAEWFMRKRNGAY